MSSFGASGDLMIEDDTGLDSDAGLVGGDAEAGMAGGDGPTARRRGTIPGTKRGRYNRVSVHARKRIIESYMAVVIGSWRPLQTGLPFIRLTNT